MRVEEIALRHEIRQMMNEAGINKTSIREMVNDVLKEEIAKQVKNSICQANVPYMIRKSLSDYDMRDQIRYAVRDEVTKAIKISVNVYADTTDKVKD